MHLGDEERSFFELVSRAAFSNPFGAERDELDRRIAEGGGEGELLDRLLGRLRTSLEGVALRESKGRDRDLLEHAVLFDVFHRFANRLDGLIRQQLRAGRESVPVPFADEVTSLLVERGVTRRRADRALPIFYQMRRAFFFIAQGLSGTSASMMRLRESLWNNVFTQDIELYERFLWDRMEDFSTIIVGETGAGKGNAAAAMGRSGFIPFDAKRGCFVESFTESFVPINLSQFSESLIESELFGHRKGAFTGAIDAHEGLLSRCSTHGSVFLDEIGEVSAPLQIKLLRVLQERAFSPVGSHETRRFEGRVIAATHQKLDELRREGKMRDDFYYRLCSDVIRVPPLRQRLAEDSGELDVLVEHITEKTVGEPSRELKQTILSALRRDLGAGYGWPGNVRELEQCVRRILLIGGCSEEHTAPTDGALEPRIEHAIKTGSASARELLNLYCAMLYERVGTYEKVAQITGLDRRTVKRHIQENQA